MQRHTGERGAALILLIGITAALAILTAALVTLLASQQGATAGERTTKTSLYYAEAGLDSGLNAIKATTSSGTNFSTTTAIDMSQMNTEYVAAYPPPAPTPTYTLYDNADTITTSTPAYDANGDHRVWVEDTVTYQGHTSRLREMLASDTSTSILPQAVLYADTDINANGTSDMYAVNKDGTPDTSGFPYVTSITAGGNFTGNSSTNLAAPGQTVQSLGINVNGSVSLPGITENGVTIGGVGLLSDYFDQARQYALTVESQTGIPTKANAGGTAVAATKFTPSNLTTAYLTSISASFNSGTKTYTFNSDLVVSGNLTLTTSAFPAGTIFNFRSLYVTGTSGNLTLTGNVTVNTAALYVGGNFTISGTTTAVTDQFGPIYVTGTADWNGGTGTSRLAIKTTSLTTTAWADPTTPGPMYAQILTVDGDTNGNYDGSSGKYDLVLGDTWIDGNAGTGDVAVNFSAPSSGINATVMCPLLATTEKTVSNGKIDFGTLLDPMVYYMQCDNDGLYSNTCEWASTGTYYGLMVIMEAAMQITGGNDGTHPNIVGSVMAGTPVTPDITLSGNSSVCYNQAAIDNLPANLQSILRTNTTTTVAGTWQQLSAH
jgi:Tfp pilus assembly protein PilX